ncbi:hypothetical protein [Dyadobacter pollutisoli]|jgi:hypothetical protein|uniref:Uncharacterized protein n=1 Tax=Dyadobacter pollutisoli TaxID=2910158 RepID=A0A9E8SLH3_9BACT|nr:hypothetical protein [Dyadobacter pollutisoli]WAC12239.1 hypothetical protein ON006_31510 [Dyadobacter pollutisoli]
METSSSQRRGVSIKQRLLARFGKAKEIVGPGWKDALAKSDPFFNTREGEAFMRSVAQAYSDPKRGHVDRIECVMLALEKISGIDERSI